MGKRASRCSKYLTVIGSPKAIAVPHDDDSTLVGHAEKQTNINITSDSDQISEKSSENVEAGVKKAGALTLTWTEKELIFASAW